jgi:hypothetical protein
LKKKKKPGLVRVRPGHPGSGSTRRVARVWPGCCHSWSFIKPGLVQPPGRPRRAGFNNCARDYYHRRQIVKNNKAKILKKGKKKSISFRKGKKNQVNPDKSLKPDLIFKTQPVKSLNHIQSRNFLIPNHFNFEG